MFKFLVGKCTVHNNSHTIFHLLTLYTMLQISLGIGVYAGIYLAQNYEVCRNYEV